MKIHVFAMGDARRQVSQPIQQSIMRNFANDNGLLIDFVGWEMAIWDKHKKLISYVDNKEFNAFLFFTIYQFWHDSRFQIDIIDRLVKNDISLYFASERLIITNYCEFNSLCHELAIVEILRGYEVEFS